MTQHVVTIYRATFFEYYLFPFVSALTLIQISNQSRNDQASFTTLSQFLIMLPLSVC
jgi:hypothetical protein